MRCTINNLGVSRSDGCLKSMTANMASILESRPRAKQEILQKKLEVLLKNQEAPQKKQETLQKKQEILEKSSHFFICGRARSGERSPACVEKGWPRCGVLTDG